MGGEPLYSSASNAVGEGNLGGLEDAPRSEQPAARRIAECKLPRAAFLVL